MIKLMTMGDNAVQDPGQEINLHNSKSSNDKSSMLVELILIKLSSARFSW